jgi:FOG: WD40-like repeat
MQNKKLAKIIVVIALLSVCLPMTTLPSTIAAGRTMPTYAFINVSPNPIGIGQSAFVNMFIDKVPPTANSQYGDRWGNYTVTVTKPDGQTETLGPFTSDAAGGAWTQYTPTVLGNYTFVFSFAGQTVQGSNPSPISGTANPSSVGNYYQPSTSDKATLVVQQDQIAHASGNPLPSEYWTRPIYATNKAWYSISGNWFGLDISTTGGYSNGGTYDHASNYESNFAPYTQAPNSPHILWTKPYLTGGIIGGEYGGGDNSMFYSVAQYETKFSPIIMNGIIYTNVMSGDGPYYQGWVATDLYTGKTLWTRNTTEPLFTGQILDYVSPNQYGGILYLWSQGSTVSSAAAQVKSSTWTMNDAYTGNKILDIVNAPSGGTLTIDAQGDLVYYYINATDWTINMWNSTQAIMNYDLQTLTQTNSWRWVPPLGAKIDWKYGIQFTQPFAINITDSNGAKININDAMNKVSSTTYNLAITSVTQNVIVVSNTGFVRFDNPGWGIMEGYDTKTGKLLWGPTNYTIPVGVKTWQVGASAEDDVFTIAIQETNSWYGFSLSTGKQLWGPVVVPHNAWSYYQYHGIIAYGNLYSADLGGYVNCLDAKTGELNWTWNTGSSGYETPYGIWPINNFELVADGKLYLLGGHQYSPPMFEGAQRYCINATSGEELWSMSAFAIANMAKIGIADGILVAPNAYDNQMYAYGKGPTKVTVTAPGIGVTTAAPITISGTVTDISSGSSQQAVSTNFPNGLPCVSDASMSGFMEAVYEQQPMPTNITGVPIVLSVMDSNGNSRVIGTTTSNTLGTFSYTWTPDISGDYTVYATFAGSESYYASTAAAAFHASEQAPTPTPAATVAPSMADLYFLPMSIGILIAIIVVGAVIVLSVRKKP